MAQLSDLVGKTMVSVENQADYEIVFTTDDGRTFKLYHDQDCCESVKVEDICGDLSDLVGAPILQADEETGETVQPAGWRPDEYCDSYTWTFYKFATVKGSVTIRWYGESNGYYSESVDFREA
jgi:hypothetical protein